MTNHRPTGFVAHKHRVVYSLFRGAARIALRLNLPMKQFVQLAQLAYFREAREERGLELAEIGKMFGKSLRTISSLNRLYRSDFFAPEDAIALRRDLALLLDRDSATFEALCERYPDRVLDLTEALDDLVHEGRLVKVDDRYRRSPDLHMLFDETDMLARVGGLNRQLDILAEATWHRLIEPGEHAAARSFVFRATDGDFERFTEEFIAMLRTRAIEIDVRADGEAHAPRRAVSFLAAPMEDP